MSSVRVLAEVDTVSHSIGTWGFRPGREGGKEGFHSSSSGAGIKNEW